MFPIPIHHPRALAILTLLVVAAPQLAAAPQGTGKVQPRSYFFEDAKKDMEYALFVPTSYAKDKPAPLVVLLHGLGSNPKQVIGYEGITAEAEKRGYIVVAPYGYNSRGWYGSRGQGKDGPYFGTKTDPDNLGALSQQDVMNVLGLVREEFRVDGDRIYLMGHSMGGAGTVHLGATYPDLWAGLAPLAPALDQKTSRLEAVKHIPVHMVSGDADRLVSIKMVRTWVEQMKQLDMDHTYVEIAGGDHVLAITRNAKMIAGVFDFFDAKRRKPVVKVDATPAGGKSESKAPAPTPAGTKAKRSAT